MFINARNKVLRKYDADFWNFLYNRRRKNKFFMYFRLSLINKIKLYYRKKFFFIKYIKRKRDLLKFKVFKDNNPFYHFIKLKNLNKFKFFRRSKYFVKRIFFKYIKPKKNKGDILFGIKSAFQHYKYKIKSLFYRLKVYIKKITLFYNNFNKKKLIKFSNLTKKSKCGGINYFFFKLESRLDSILLRLNIGTKFYVRKIIKSNLILVNNLQINYLNFIIKPSDIISFKKSLKKRLYLVFRDIIKFKRFFAQPPFYMEVNYRTLCILLIPKLIDPFYIPYPFLFTKNEFVTGLHTTLWGW
jgi:ribosomal protein S4